MKILALITLVATGVLLSEMAVSRQGRLLARYKKMAVEWRNDGKDMFKAVDRNGNTGLHLAIRAGGMDAVRFWLENGSDPNTLNNAGDTPLAIAIVARNVRAIELLLASGADPNIGEGSLLHKVARNAVGKSPRYKGNKILRLMLEHKADPNAVDSQGKTPLFGIHMDGAIKLLVRNGADVNHVDGRGQTPLYYAVRWYRGSSMVKYLVKNGADTDHVDNEGRTPLHSAAEAGTFKIVDYLLENGASPDVRDKYGHTPADSATQKWELYSPKYPKSGDGDSLYYIKRDLRRTIAMLRAEEFALIMP